MMNARAAFRQVRRTLVRKYASMTMSYSRNPDIVLCGESAARMTNPYLADTTTRASRDVVRKLGSTDRIFGTMALALEHGIEPSNMAVGALAGIALLLANAGEYGLPQEWRA
jgi:mannitol-1-phosphate/altronate dehydrogenase